MAGHKRTVGPVSRRLAANLKLIRMSRGLTQADLARRLTDLGWPVLDTGLCRTETGIRRVDVDELCALAVALECSPTDLLFASPAMAMGYETEVEAVPGIHVPITRLLSAAEQGGNGHAKDWTAPR